MLEEKPDERTREILPTKWGSAVM
uniref:Uncharacterized protein n=1 Tax=Arundo donax TaxID=35708 RepID=A0A0A8ZZL3_ARUDO